MPEFTTPNPMQKKNLFAIVFLAMFVMTVIGCDSQKEVIQNDQKTGMNAQERKEKRGE
jgi:uncharacterized protein YcfL